VTAALGEALRLLGLPVDRTVDAPMLASAYRDAARGAHPDAAAPEERDTQTERMRAVNLARDLVRNHLHALGAEPYAAFAPGDDGPPLDDAWMAQAAMDADGLGVRWNPNTAPVSWSVRFDAARRALAIAVGDGVIVAEDGNILVGRVKAFDQSVRVGLRTVIQGLPVEVRRVGVEIEFEDGSVRTVDAADVEASAWRCPVCLRTSVHGVPRQRPCPRCLRRARTAYPHWRDLGASRRRLRRRIARLDAEPAPFSARRSPRYRETEDAAAEATSRVESLEATREALAGAIAEAQAAADLAAARVERARSESGQAKRNAERKKYAADARKAEAALAVIESQIAETRERARALAAERDSLAREMQARHDASQRVREAGEHRRIDERQRAEKELREVELELAAVAPDAPALLDGFDAWGQAPERWLGPFSMNGSEPPA
jgi:predicted  nucleic acid-binding Zn-ribbon protein